MEYKYAIQKDVTKLNLWCLDVIHDVQKIVKDYFTFDIRLIGSGEKRLVTQDENGVFDLDYDLIIQRDKKELLNNPKAIKQVFINAFNDAMRRRISNYNHVYDSTSVIRSNILLNNEISFSFDVALLVKADNDSYYRIINDKGTGNYIWNQVRGSKNYLERFQIIKQQGHWEDFKERYLYLKNFHYNRGDKVKSFSIFLETLNEFEQ